jgi:hypothetical protein
MISVTRRLRRMIINDNFRPKRTVPSSMAFALIYAGEAFVSMPG